MYPDGVDDVDILFARLESAAPPVDLRQRVLASVQARSRRRRLVGYVLLAAAILVAAFVSFSLGQQLRVSGALALLDFVGDIELLGAAPSEVLLAFVELIPWPLAALVAASLAVVVAAVPMALSPSPRLGTRSPER